MLSVERGAEAAANGHTSDLPKFDSESTSCGARMAFSHMSMFQQVLGQDEEKKENVDVTINKSKDDEAVFLTPKPPSRKDKDMLKASCYDEDQNNSHLLRRHHVEQRDSVIDFQRVISGLANELQTTISLMDELGQDYRAVNDNTNQVQQECQEMLRKQQQMLVYSNRLKARYILIHSYTYALTY